VRAKDLRLVNAVVPATEVLAKAALEGTARERIMASADASEGPAAIREKRAPRFSGG
jgi:hypothetical protein